MTTVSEAPGQAGGAGAEAPIRSASFIVFDLVFTEPGGVTVPGEPGRDEDGKRTEPQAVLDTGPDDRPWLPGASLAGALRDLVGARAEDWFGPLLSKDVEAKASPIWVYGGTLKDASAITPEERSSTAIDRHRGAASGHTLRGEQMLPAGTRFEVVLRWDDADPGDIADFASLIAGWRPFIGRGVSRGRGRCAVEAVRYGTLRLTDPADLLTWLTLDGPPLAQEVATTPVEAPAGTPGPGALLRATATVTGPLHVGDGIKPEPGSQDPLRLLRGGGGIVVPGTTLKGVIRSRAEFILRSVGLSPEPCDGTPGCGVCWTCETFGYGGGEDESSSAVGRRAAIRFADAAVAGAKTRTRTHTAIDRFTGGVLDSALYSVEALEAGTFPVAVDPLAQLTDQRAEEIRAVLRLVIEDLNDGLIGLGRGTARGYGSVTVEFPGPGEPGGLPELAEAQAVLERMVAGG